MNAEMLRRCLLFVLPVLLLFAVHPGAGSGSFAPPDPAVLEEFDVMKAFIEGMSADLQKGIRSSLIKKIENARSAYQRSKPCTAVNILGAFLEQTSALLSGRKLSAAEELRNRGWMLRYEILVHLPPGVTCPGFESFDAAAALNIHESDNKHFEASVSFGTALLQTVPGNGELWTQVQIPSLESQAGAPGMPAVPTWRAFLAVPEGAKVRLNQVSPKIRQQIPLHLCPFQVQPGDEQLPSFDFRYADLPFQVNEAAYAQNEFYPSQVCTIGIVGQSRDVTIAQVSCAAGQYHPAAGAMRLFASIDFQVLFEGGQGTFITEQTLSPFEKSSESAMGTVVNQAVLRDHVATVDWEDLPCYGEELLILTHPDFKEAAEDLADWKREKGISSTVVQVGNGTTCDEGHEIDDLIERRYDHCAVRPSYILLLGDAEYIPPARQDVDTSDACGPCEDETTGSDYGYAMYPRFLFDIFPDFAVARIPVDTEDEAKLVVERIIRYESEPPFIDSLQGEPFYTTTAHAAAFQCCRMDQDGSPRNGNPGTDQRAFIETSEWVRDRLLGLGYAVERIYTETVDSGGYCLDDLSPCTLQQAYSGNTIPNRYHNGSRLPADLRSGSGFPWAGLTADIVSSFNEGRFLILQRDHGVAAGISHPVFNIHNLSSLANKEFLPVVYAVSCLSGYFDRETDAGIPNECFMEQLLLLPGGGMVGGLAANRESPTWANNALTRGFYDATWPGILPEFGAEASKRRLGDILNHAKMYLLTQTGASQTAGDISLEAALGNLSLWHAFGDPTLEMWTANPHGFLLVLDYFYELHDDNMVVRYDRNGAVITALQESAKGTVPVGRATVENGVAAIRFFFKPQTGLPIRLSAGFENAVSVQFDPVPYECDLLVEEIELDSIHLMPGTDLAGLLKLKIGNLGNASAPGTVNPDGSVKDPPQGYMIDLVLSADTDVPEGFAVPADEGGTSFKEDALLVGGRVSRTPDVPAGANVILPADPPLSSGVGGVIPLQTPPGLYYLCARIDPGDAVQEADEGNNLTCLQITLGNPQMD